MNNHLTQSLKFFLLLVLALSSGCGQSIASSPKGFLVYSDYATIYSFNVENADTKTIVSTHGPFYGMDIKDNYVYFSSEIRQNDLPGNIELYKIKFNGSDLVQLTSGAKMYSGNYFSSISLARDYLAYFNGNDESLVVLDKNLSIVKTIVEEDGHNFAYPPPQLSPYGKEILVLDNWTTQEGLHSRLLLYSLENSEIKELLTDVSLDDMVWSPNGKYILLKLKGVEQTEIIILGMNDFSEKRFPIKGNLSNYSWSPDSKNIAFSAWEKERSTLNVLNVENGNIDTSSEFKDVPYIHNISWSPNGNLVLYEVSDSSLNEHSLYELDYLGKRTTNIFTQEGIIKVTSTNQTKSQWYFLPTWSPDSNYFAYLSTSNSNKGSFTLNIQNVTTGYRVEYEIPSNEWIYKIYWIYP